MAKVTLQVDIAAPVEEVFEFVADYRNALDYMAHFQSFRPVTRHTYGLGAEVLAAGRLHGVPIATRLRVVEFEKNRRLVSVSNHGLRSTSAWSFEPYGGGTRVTFVADYALPRVPLAGKLLGGLLDEEIRAGTRRTLEKLKLVLERRQNGQAGLSDE